jgi:hypothetical protein
VSWINISDEHDRQKGGQDLGRKADFVAKYLGPGTQVAGIPGDLRRGRKDPLITGREEKSSIPEELRESSTKNDRVITTK